MSLTVAVWQTSSTPLDVEGNLERLARVLAEAAQAGDAAALALLSDIGRWVGEGCASLAAVLDPAVFVIGGGLAEAGDLVLESARIHFADELTGGGHRPSPRFVVAQLGNDAGVIGAAALAERGRA